jgi:hypothetical protein
MYTTKGTIKVINQTQVISESFSKREFVIETDGQYPKPNAFQVTKDKCSLLDNFKVGQQVEVFWNLNGKEWTSPAGEVKYFNTLEAWKIEVLGAVSVPQAKQSTTPANEEEDDLPF